MVRTLLARLLRRYQNRPDPALTVQRPVVKFTGYEPDKAVASQRAADQRFRLRAKLEARRAERWR